MKPTKIVAVVVAVAAIALTPSAASADGAQAFKNCTEAYDHGHANIPEGSPYYADRLDRDRDGIGCDNPPDDFVAVKDDTADRAKSNTSRTDQNLAETGGDQTTAWIAVGGAGILAVGGTLTLAARRKKPRANG